MRVRRGKVKSLGQHRTFRAAIAAFAFVVFVWQFATQTSAGAGTLPPQTPASVVGSSNHRVPDTVDDLAGVSCSSTLQCISVGYYVNHRTAFPLAEIREGNTWAMTPIANPPSDSRFTAVSCSSTSFCMAVGNSVNAGVSESLSEMWNGTAWSFVPTPDPSSSENFLNSISCLSSTQCVAVGYIESNVTGELNPLLALWDGNAWSAISSASPPPDGTLWGVSCADPSRCMAVGSLGQFLGTLAESWNGTTWSVDATPNNAGTTQDPLWGVSCPSPSRCVAVGSYGTLTSLAFSEAWDGTSWLIVPTARPGTRGLGSSLRSTSCPSASRCISVGSFVGRQRLVRTLTESWNGNRSARTPSSNATLSSQLSGVSCTSAVQCTAVGSDQIYPRSFTLIEQWNGNTWAVEASPNA
jgi:hypothetical protein